MIYSATVSDAPDQGDVFDDCPIGRIAGNGSIQLASCRAIVLTQSCDLDQRKAERVLMAPAHAASDFVAGGAAKASTVKDHIRFGRVYGLYFLPAFDPLPELILDLRDVFTLPRSVLESLIAAGRRPARLASPFREHLVQHFALTYMRIALPIGYDTTP